MSLINLVRVPWPLWLLVAAVKLAWRAVRFAFRHRMATFAGLVLLVFLVRHGWRPVAVGLVLAGWALTVWAVADWESWRRLVGWRVVGLWRRARYRRRWPAVMTTVGLTVLIGRTRWVPALTWVEHRPTRDVLTVRLVRGQTRADVARVAHRLAAAFSAIGCKVGPSGVKGAVRVALRWSDPLTNVVSPFPVPAVPDTRRLPVAVDEDGQVWPLRLRGSHVLVIGATDAGKGSVLWALLSALAGGIRAGLVQVWAVDPKGGMELTLGAALFTRFARDQVEEMADLLDEALATARARMVRLRDVTRQHEMSVDEPLIVIVIDELAGLTAYVNDRKLRDRIRETLAVLLTQGRAVGVHVIGCSQDPRQEVLALRHLFPTRIALRLLEPKHADLVLGDGALDEGAECHLIPRALPGVAYVAVDGDKTPIRVRFAHHDDTAVRWLAGTYPTPHRRPVTAAPTPSAPTIVDGSGGRPTVKEGNTAGTTAGRATTGSAPTAPAPRKPSVTPVRPVKPGRRALPPGPTPGGPVGPVKR